MDSPFNITRGNYHPLINSVTEKGLIRRSLKDISCIFNAINQHVYMASHEYETSNK